MQNTFMVDFGVIWCSLVLNDTKKVQVQRVFDTGRQSEAAAYCEKAEAAFDEAIRGGLGYPEAADSGGGPKTGSGVGQPFAERKR
jgi:hypothetical protein